MQTACYLLWGILLLLQCQVILTNSDQSIAHQWFNKLRFEATKCTKNDMGEFSCCLNINNSDNPQFDTKACLEWSFSWNPPIIHIRININDRTLADFMKETPNINKRKEALVDQIKYIEDLLTPTDFQILGVFLRKINVGMSLPITRRKDKKWKKELENKNDGDEEENKGYVETIMKKVDKYFKGDIIGVGSKDSVKKSLRGRLKDKVKLKGFKDCMRRKGRRRLKFLKCIREILTSKGKGGDASNEGEDSVSKKEDKSHKSDEVRSAQSNDNKDDEEDMDNNEYIAAVIKNLNKYYKKTAIPKSIRKKTLKTLENNLQDEKTLKQFKKCMPEKFSKRDITLDAGNLQDFPIQPRITRKYLKGLANILPTQEDLMAAKCVKKFISRKDESGEDSSLNTDEKKDSEEDEKKDSEEDEKKDSEEDKTQDLLKKIDKYLKRSKVISKKDRIKIMDQLEIDLKDEEKAKEFEDCLPKDFSKKRSFVNFNESGSLLQPRFNIFDPKGLLDKIISKLPYFDRKILKCIKKLIPDSDGSEQNEKDESKETSKERDENEDEVDEEAEDMLKKIDNYLKGKLGDKVKISKNERKTIMEKLEKDLKDKKKAKEFKKCMPKDFPTKKRSFTQYPESRSAFKARFDIVPTDLLDKLMSQLPLFGRKIMKCIKKISPDGEKDSDDESKDTSGENDENEDDEGDIAEDIIENINNYLKGEGSDKVKMKKIYRKTIIEQLREDLKDKNKQKEFKKCLLKEPSKGTTSLAQHHKSRSRSQKKKKFDIKGLLDKLLLKLPPTGRKIIRCIKKISGASENDSDESEEDDSKNENNADTFKQVDDYFKGKYGDKVKISKKDRKKIMDQLKKDLKDEKKAKEFKKCLPKDFPKKTRSFAQNSESGSFLQRRLKFDLKDIFEKLQSKLPSTGRKIIKCMKKITSSEEGLPDGNDKDNDEDNDEEDKKDNDEDNVENNDKDNEDNDEDRNTGSEVLPKLYLRTRKIRNEDSQEILFSALKIEPDDFAKRALSSNQISTKIRKTNLRKERKKKENKNKKKNKNNKNKKKKTKEENELKENSKGNTET